MYRRILLALGPSDDPGVLAPPVAEIARRSGGEALIVHVLPIGTSGRPERGVEEAVETLEDHGVRTVLETPVADRGHVASAIADAAGFFGADLIVLGSRGLGELRGILTGSVSRGVIVRTDVPLLLIRQGSRPAAATPERALVAVASVADVDSLVEALDGIGHLRDVIVFHVREVASTAARMAMPSAELDMEAEQTLHRAVEALREAGYHVTGRLAYDLVGNLGYVIAKEAEHCEADVTVVASNRLGGVQGVILGSTARSVVHRSDRPVLIAGRQPVPDLARAGQGR